MATNAMVDAECEWANATGRHSNVTLNGVTRPSHVTERTRDRSARVRDGQTGGYDSEEVRTYLRNAKDAGHRIVDDARDDAEQIVTDAPREAVDIVLAAERKAAVRTDT